ncbi:MAG: hypothetical protein ACKVW3_10585 [Phycisphaerales bacterium]
MNDLPTNLTADEIVVRLSTASKRGRLAGFARGKGDVLFTVDAFGTPFDGDVVARLRDGKLLFETRMRRKLPIIFAIVIAATIWPGVYFMDQLIPGEWGWIPTWWWYIPITVIPIPWMWRSVMRKSRAGIAESSREAIQKVTTELK